MHYSEISAAVLKMIFSKIVFLINHLCDLCGVVEDGIRYFLLYCTKHLDERQVFNDTVRNFQPININ